jgi:hypothetical protein
VNDFNSAQGVSGGAIFLALRRIRISMRHYAGLTHCRVRLQKGHSKLCRYTRGTQSIPTLDRTAVCGYRFFLIPHFKFLLFFPASPSSSLPFNSLIFRLCFLQHTLDFSHNILYICSIASHTVSRPMIANQSSFSAFQNFSIFIG